MNLSRLPAEILRFLGQLAYGPLRDNDSRIAAALRTRLLGGRCYIDTGVHVASPGRFSAGPRSALYHGAYVLNRHGRLTLGPRSHLGAYCYVNVLYGSVTIGEGVAVGPGTKIIAYSNHYGPGRQIVDERTQADIVIGDNVFIGANCTILPGARIHSHVIVGAGAVVRGELEPNSVYAGVPARKVRSGWYE